MMDFLSHGRAGAKPRKAVAAPLGLSALRHQPINTTEWTRVGRFAANPSDLFPAFGGIADIPVLAAGSERTRFANDQSGAWRNRLQFHQFDPTHTSSRAT